MGYEQGQKCKFSQWLQCVDCEFGSDPSSYEIEGIFSQLNCVQVSSGEKPLFNPSLIWNED